MIPKIVIVEDNSNLVEYLEELLKTSSEYDVTSFQSGTEALKYLKANKPDLVIIDLMLGDLHGKTVTEETRKMYADLPIIILTGDSSEESIVTCLSLGADDYITKPFSSQEFLARIKAKIRNVINDNKTTSLQCQDIKLDMDKLEVYMGNKKIDLTSKEFELLHYLIQNKFRVCTRENILFAVWGYSSEVETRVVDVHIGKLRKKLETKNKKYINSIRGYGYRMIEEE